MAHHAADGLDVAARLVVEGGGEEAPEGVHGDGDATPVPQGADGLGDAGGVHAVQSPLMVAVLEQVVVTFETWIVPSFSSLPPDSPC